MSNPSKLSRSIIRRLGKVSDVTLAAETGVSVATIRSERTCRGLSPASRESFKWTKHRIALLGAVPDLELARRWDRSPNTVGNKRRKLGIRPNVPATGDRQHTWRKRQLAWLGKLTDRDIADRIGLSATSVRQKRQILGIPPAGGRQSRAGAFKWTRRQIALLGTLSDGAVAIKLRIGRNQVQDKRRQLKIPSAAGQTAETRWTPKTRARLGQEPDRAIAADLGISTSAVSAFRLRQGIRAAGRSRH